PRNSTIPVARAQEFTTYKDGQAAMAIHVVQGEREKVSDCRSLARFELRGIPPMAAGVARIGVTFQVDADGLLSVTARENASGVEAAIEVKPSYGLNDGEIARMLADSFAHAADDMRVRALGEAQVEGAQLIDIATNALFSDGTLIGDSERARIDAAIVALTHALQGDDAAAVRAATDALNSATTPLAARRMDRDVKRALAGKRIDSLVGDDHG
ncbi:MAG: Hsp70 family protein, partial [Casimicrobiaceae bacterium]